MLDQLHAVPLTNAGLIEALKRQCEALEFRTGARVELNLGDLPPSEDLPPGAQEAILRAAQEALANVGKHARAGNVLVSLRAGGGRVELRIKDDGAGFDTNQSASGQGIANMHARAEEFGGILELKSRPGTGTSVVFSIPHTISETPREYRHRAMGTGVVFVLSALAAAWTGQMSMAAWAALCAVVTVRYWVAYRRALKRNEVAR